MDNTQVDASFFDPNFYNNPANSDWIVASKTDSASSPSTSTNSVWGSGLLTTINSLAGTTGTLYNAIAGKPKPATAKPLTTQQLMPWIIAGLAALVLGALLLRRS